MFENRKTCGRRGYIPTVKSKYGKKVNYYSFILVTGAKMKTTTSALIKSAPYKSEINILVAAGLKIQTLRVSFCPLL